jgi:signal transduction histidine kinase
MTDSNLELRVLVAAPTGRDSGLILDLLTSHGIPCVSTPTAEMARLALQTGAGAVIFAEEALGTPDIALWAAQVADQPAWSDLPLILLTVAGAVDRESQRKALARRPLGNVVLLERPVRPETFVSAVQAALRTRSRQYRMRDLIADRLVAEELFRKAEKLAVARRLAASISHEVNNPLASVTNLLFLIGVSSSLEEAKRYTAMAAGELARACEAVTQSLRFHRESSKPVPVNVVQIVNSALALYQARLASAEVAIERDFRECLPILGSAGELRQLILSLIANSLNAIGRRGTMKIRISSACEHSNGSRPGIRITIGDTGCGISSEIRETLFEPFVTGKGETGTGLGLWLSSEIVRKHGGTIQVKSRAQLPFTGTVFSIFLPEHHDWLSGYSSRRVPDSGLLSARSAISDSAVLQGA